MSSLSCHFRPLQYSRTPTRSTSGTRYPAQCTQHVIPPLPRTMHTAFRYPRYLAQLYTAFRYPRYHAQLCKQSVANYPAPSAPYPAQCTQHVMPPLPRTMHTVFRYPRYIAQLYTQHVAHYHSPSTTYLHSL